MALALFHVTDKHKDLQFVLPAEGDGRYVLHDEHLAAILAAHGIWYLELRGTTEAWKVSDRLETPASAWSVGG